MVVGDASGDVVQSACELVVLPLCEEAVGELVGVVGPDGVDDDERLEACVAGRVAGALVEDADAAEAAGGVQVEVLKGGSGDSVGHAACQAAVVEAVTAAEGD